MTPQTPVAAGFVSAQLSSGLAASCLHRGHCTDLPHAYKALEQWVAAQGLTVTGDAFELYLNDSEQTPPAAWLTRITMPLE